MNAPIASAALALLVSASPPDIEPVTLHWQLPAGAAYRIDASRSYSTTNVTMGVEQEQFQEDGVVYLATVEDVDEEGDMHLSVVMERVEMVQESEQQTISLSAERDEEGEKVIDVSIEAAAPMLEGDDVQELFEALAGNMLDVEFRFEVTPLGEVVATEVEGDPFADLPADTEVTRMVSEMIPMMIAVDDLPALVSAELFARLPEAPVEPTDTWDVARSLTVVGMEMTGKGTSTLLGVEDGVAELREEMSYQLDAQGMAQTIEDVTSTIVQSQGGQMEIQVDLEGEDFEAVSLTRFDVAAGHTRSTVWESMTMRVGGTMYVGEQDMEMEVEVLAENAFSWEKVDR